MQKSIKNLINFLQNGDEFNNDSELLKILLAHIYQDLLQAGEKHKVSVLFIVEMSKQITMRLKDKVTINEIIDMLRKIELDFKFGLPYFNYITSLIVGNALCLICHLNDISLNGVYRKHDELAAQGAFDAI